MCLLQEYIVTENFTTAANVVLLYRYIIISVIIVAEPSCGIHQDALPALLLKKVIKNIKR